MNITINVVGQKLKTNYTQIVEGSQNFVKFTFNLPNEWKEINPSACFSQEGKAPIGKILETDTDGQTFFTYLPPEITEGKCELSLFGAKESENGDVIGTSNCLTLTIDKKGSIDDVIESTPTPSVYKDWIDKIELDALNTVEAVFQAEKDAMVAATTAANEAADKTEKAVKDANDALDIAIAAEESINETLDKAVSNYDFVAAIQENVAEDVMLKSEYAETVDNNSSQIAELSETVAGLKSIPVYMCNSNELPADAKEGDLCLWSEPNSLESADSGGRIYIDWDSILSFADSFKEAGDEYESLFFGLTEIPSYGYLNFEIERHIIDDIKGFSVSITNSEYEDIGETADSKTPCKIKDFSIRIDNGIINPISIIAETYYPTDIDVNDDVYVKTIWEAPEDTSDLTQLPKYIDIGLWRILDSSASEGDLQNLCTLFHSPYRLMVYRDGWTRLNSSTALNKYNINH